MHIEMVDDERYSATCVGTITFQRELGNPLTLKYVMYVPGLKNNLVFFSMLGDDGCDVIFSEVKAFLHHKATGQVKNIGVRLKTYTNWMQKIVLP